MCQFAGLKQQAYKNIKEHTAKQNKMIELDNLLRHLKEVVLCGSKNGSHEYTTKINNNNQMLRALNGQAFNYLEDYMNKNGFDISIQVEKSPHGATEITLILK